VTTHFTFPTVNYRRVAFFEIEEINNSIAEDGSTQLQRVLVLTNGVGVQPSFFFSIYRLKNNTSWIENECLKCVVEDFGQRLKRKIKNRELAAR
jgi:hypothetical protein